MRWLSQLLVILVICLVAVALPSAPAQAVCVPWSIELFPSSGLPGTNVTIYGQGFSDLVLADIYYDGDLVATGRTDTGGDFTLTFIVPEGCTGHYQVLAHVGIPKVDTYFTVRPGLVISPEKGPVGTTVTVSGLGFARNEQGIELMYYSGDSSETIERNIEANAQGSWETSFQIPSSSRGEHKISAQGAETNLYKVEETMFRVTAEISLDKSSGSVGDTITMTGSRFGANEKDIKILFEGEAVVTGIKASAKGEWQASFQVPDVAAREYSVTAEGQATKTEDIVAINFEIESDIVLSPTEGHVGMDVTVTGNGFAASTDVDIMYDGSVITTTETDENGDFQTSFVVPESQHGEHLVAAGYSGENHSNAIFIMESEAPDRPDLISPSNGSRFGLIGDAIPTFEWSEVSDDSGVRYSLQIATTGDFAASSVIVSVAGLTETDYTLEEKDALPNGSYYWRVRAADGAENESDWTVAGSFRAGLLPLWGFIAAIAAAVALFALLIRAAVRRRGIYYDRW
ncbi:MAG: hypothetical protein A2Z77_09505 [Chloroflexi bacterium RBG_13_51_36]|nr:MAG: hypothetical protein A2Z77_09505 [Chloroflexi bacterium RBG_13_51_36]